MKRVVHIVMILSVLSASAIFYLAGKEAWMVYESASGVATVSKATVQAKKKGGRHERK